MLDTATLADREEALDRWLAPFLERFQRAEHRHWAPLSLPKAWTDAPARHRKAGVPEDVRFRTKGEIALDEHAFRPAPPDALASGGEATPRARTVRDLPCTMSLLSRVQSGAPTRMDLATQCCARHNSRVDLRSHASLPRVSEDSKVSHPIIETREELARRIGDVRGFQIVSGEHSDRIEGPE